MPVDERKEPSLSTQNEPWLEEVPEDVEAIAGSAKRSFATVAVSLIVLVGFVAAIVWVYGRANENPMMVQGDVPTIEAEPTPIKVEPEDRGGLEVPDRDKMIFKGISGKERSVKEKVQDAAEQPVARPVPQGGTIEESTIDTNNADTVANGDIAKDEGTQTLTDVADKEANTATPPIKIEEKPAEKVAVIEKPVVAAPKATLETIPASRTIPADSFLIQLGAFGKKEAVETAWKGFQQKFPDHLRNLTLKITQVNLGQRGVLYRLQAGPFATRAGAARTCDALKAQKQACNIVTP